MTEVRTEENAIIYSAAKKLVSLGVDAAKLSMGGKEYKKPLDNGKKILTIFKAYKKKAEMSDAEVDALLYCLRSLSEDSSFPTTSPIVGKDLSVQIQLISGITFFDEGVELGDATEVDFVGSGGQATKSGNRVTLNISGGSGIPSIGVVDVSPGTIVLDMASAVQRNFIASASIGAIKTWSFANSSNAQSIQFFNYTMTTLSPQTMPINVKMNSALIEWDDTLKTWTPLQTGKFKAMFIFDGTNIILEITGPY